MNADVVNCYFHAKKGFLLIPTAENAAGIGKSINRPQALAETESDAELGAAARRSQQWCDFALYDKEVPIPAVTATGARSWSQFARAWQLMNVAFDETIRLTPTTRDERADYWFLVDQTWELPLTATDAQLGAAIRHTLSQCREGPRGY